MKQIKAHIAVSLDGHTATLDKELDWLPDEVKTIVGKYYLDADCLLMGANTYNYIFEHWGGWPHKSKRSFVVSHYDTNVTPDCGVEFLTEEPLQRVYELKQETAMLVVGGGKLLTSLIKAGLLDSLTIYTVPVMAGKGIGFIGETFGSHWKLSESMFSGGHCFHCILPVHRSRQHRYGTWRSRRYDAATSSCLSHRQTYR